LKEVVHVLVEEAFLFQVASFLVEAFPFLGVVEAFLSYLVVAFPFLEVAFLSFLVEEVLPSYLEVAFLFPLALEGLVLGRALEGLVGLVLLVASCQGQGLQVL